MVATPNSVFANFIYGSPSRRDLSCDTTHSHAYKVYNQKVNGCCKVYACGIWWN